MFLTKQGLNEAAIAEKLENLPEQKTLSIGMDLEQEEKVWEIDQQLEIDWRIPMDVTRVMIFERLEYVIMR